MRLVHRAHPADAQDLKNLEAATQHGADFQNGSGVDARAGRGGGGAGSSDCTGSGGYPASGSRAGFAGGHIEGRTAAIGGVH